MNPNNPILRDKIYPQYAEIDARIDKLQEILTMQQAIIDGLQKNVEILLTYLIKDLP